MACSHNGRARVRSSRIPHDRFGHERVRSAMKVSIAFLVLALSLTAAIPAHADSVPRDASRAAGYDPDALTSRRASLIVTGFTGSVGNNHTYVAGSLYAGWKGTLLSATLLNVLFNSTTVISTTKLAGHDDSPYLANAST